MYEITIDNVLGIEEAEITLTPGHVTEVIGPNASGKTSIATCAQAVLCYEPNPLGLAGPEAKRSYPREGAVDDSSVRLRCGDGSEAVWWPSSQKVTAPTTDPPSRPEAVGIVDFRARRGAKERAALLQGALLPPPEDVAAALRDHLEGYLPPDDLEGALAMLAERGWEATEAVFSDRARQAKREWSSISGTNYGSKVAADWRPNGWQAGYDHMTIQEAEALIVDARDALNVLHQVQAISQADADAASSARGDLPALEAKEGELSAKVAAFAAQMEQIPIADARRSEDEATAAHKRAKVAHQRLAREEVAVATLKCPACAARLVLINGELVTHNRHAEQAMLDEHARSLSAAEQRVNELDGARLKASNLSMSLRMQHNEIYEQREPFVKQYRSAQADIAAARRVAARSGEVETPERGATLSRAEQAVEDARQVVALVRAEAEARQLQETVARYTAVKDALGPQGVRARMLTAGLADLNAGLAIISEVAKWPLTVVDDAGGITSGGRAIQLCSESEQWRAQASIQLTIAALTEARVVVLDRFDILDAENRIAFQSVANRITGATDVAILVCTTRNVATMATLSHGWWTQVLVPDYEIVP